MRNDGLIEGDTVSTASHQKSNRKSVGPTNHPVLGLLMRLRKADRARIKLACLALSSLCLFSGCTSVSSSIGSLFSGGCMSEAIELHRNRTCALKAWFRREHNFCNQSNLRDFKDGFIDGYVAIAEGKPGCPPSTPPKRYWSWAYQTPEGQSQMAAWYAGYPYGVQAAKDDGLSNHNHITLGPNFQTKPQNQSWNSVPFRTYSPSSDYNGSGIDEPMARPLPNGANSSILQDSSSLRSGGRASELFSDLDFSMED